MLILHAPEPGGQHGSPHTDSHTENVKYIDNLDISIYEFPNRESAEKVAKEGLCMKEDKDFYKEGILTGISNIFEGLTYEEIYAILIDCVAYTDVKIRRNNRILVGPPYGGFFSFL